MASEDNLQTCSKCNTGSMRPTGKAGTDGEPVEPFGEVSEGRKFECDSCGHVEFDANITERSEVGDSVSASVKKKK
jgi:hypothetical protein